jgi:hypothetical protein
MHFRFFAVSILLNFVEIAAGLSDMVFFFFFKWNVVCATVPVLFIIKQMLNFSANS